MRAAGREAIRRISEPLPVKEGRRVSRKGQSQWEFGELFPAEPARVVLTVSELTARVRRLLEQQFGAVAVTGEVSNLRAQSSGHVYFTLKDAGAQLSCVLWRSTAIRDRDLLRDGQKMVAQGDLTVYEPRGQYQLVVGRSSCRGWERCNWRSNG
jgi:hypothetical protein